MAPLTLHLAPLRAGTQEAVGEALGKKTRFLSGTLSVVSSPSSHRYLCPRRHPYIQVLESILASLHLNPRRHPCIQVQEGILASKSQKASLKFPGSYVSEQRIHGQWQKQKQLLEKIVLLGMEASQRAENRQRTIHYRMGPAFMGHPRSTCLLVKETPWRFILSMLSLTCSPDKEMSLVSLPAGIFHVNLDASFCRPYSLATVSGELVTL